MLQRWIQCDNKRIVTVLIAMCVANAFVILFLTHSASPPGANEPDHLKPNIDAGLHWSGMEDSNTTGGDPDAVFGDLRSMRNSKGGEFSKQRTLEAIRRIWLHEYRHAYGRQPPDNYAKWIELAIQNRCYLHPKYYAQINKDLLPFRDPLRPSARSISRQMLENAKALRAEFPFYVAVLTVSRRGGLSVENSSLSHVWQRIFPRRVLDVLPEHSVELVVNLEEARVLSPDPACWTRAHKPEHFELHGYLAKVKQRLPAYIQRTNGIWLRPLFSQSKLDCHMDILIPGPLQILSYQVKPGGPWRNKSNTFVWRGSTTGCDCLPDRKYEKTHRFRFVDWAMQRADSPTMTTTATQRHNEESNASTSVVGVGASLPVALDVAFNKALQCAPASVCDQIRRRYTFKRSMTRAQQHRAKYIPVIDGNTYAARLRGFFFSNSLKFVSTLFTEWYSNWVQPFVHYVPFDLEYTELAARLRWAHANDERAQQIASAGQALAEQHLTRLDMQCYTALLVLEYAQLLELP